MFQFDDVAVDLKWILHEIRCTLPLHSSKSSLFLGMKFECIRRSTHSNKLQLMSTYNIITNSPGKRIFCTSQRDQSSSRVKSQATDDTEKCYHQRDYLNSLSPFYEVTAFLSEYSQRNAHNLDEHFHKETEKLNISRRNNGEQEWNGKRVSLK